MSKNQIVIRCEGATNMPLEKMVALQGKLKYLPEENYQKLKQSMITHGFAYPANIARMRGKAYGILDAHQRHRALYRMMKEEGFVLIDKEGHETDSIPVTFTDCKNKSEAGRLILQAISQYGKISAEGLGQFMIDYDIEKDILPEFDLPDTNCCCSSFNLRFAKGLLFPK